MVALPAVTTVIGTALSAGSASGTATFSSVGAGAARESQVSHRMTLRGCRCGSSTRVVSLARAKRRWLERIPSGGTSNRGAKVAGSTHG